MEATIINNSEIMTTKELFYSLILIKQLLKH